MTRILRLDDSDLQGRLLGRLDITDEETLAQLAGACRGEKQFKGSAVADRMKQGLSGREAISESFDRLLFLGSPLVSDLGL